MQISFDISVTCSRCGISRDWPDSEQDTPTLRGQRVLLVRGDRPCEECGCDRVKLEAKFGTKPL